MPTDVIRISGEARSRLEARERQDESVTDVIICPPDRTADVERFIGTYAELDLDAGVASVEERFNRDTREPPPDLR